METKEKTKCGKGRANIRKCPTAKNIRKIKRKIKRKNE